MTDKEKEAIEYFKKEIEQFQKAQESADKEIDDRSWFKKLWCEWQNDIEMRTTVLNLIGKQQEEIVVLKRLNENLQNDFDNFKKNKDINYLDGIHHKQLVENSIGQKIDNPEECWFDIFEVKVIKDNMLYGITINEDFITLKQISDSDPDNCITVIAESPLSGAIYRYNNYGTKEWQLIGTMLGYA